MNIEAEHTEANKKVGCHAADLQQVLLVLLQTLQVMTL